MVYYRKYRPQTIAELDSPKLRETLYAVLSQKEIPHAFLFTGPKGLGKTSTARIIAKVLNCERNALSKERSAKSGKALSSKPLALSDIEPCGQCDQCVSITNGNNIDVLEIDGASNRGIDEIRELRERVNLAPSAARMKVYIIDEVHMLTNEAFNALLKTIEEPPAHVVFIFATTEPQKVPATIISRCFHISLDRATPEEVTHALKRIVKSEKIDITDDALELIARLADGGYRDATKILEEIVALAGDQTITKEFIEKYNNTTGVSLDVDDFLGGLQQKNVVLSLTKIKSISDRGVSIKYVIEQVLAKLHELLLSKVDIGKRLPNAPDFSLEEIQTLVTLFSEAYQQTKYAVIPSLPLELAVVQYCQSKKPSTPGVEGPNTPGVSPDSSTVIPAKAGIQGKEWIPHQVRDDNKRSGMTLKDIQKKEQNLKVQNVLKGPKVPKEPEEPKGEGSVQNNLPQDSSDTKLLLENLIYKVKPYNHSVAGVLRGCSIKSLDNTILILQTPYQFHKEKLDEHNIREILEKVTREVTGKSLKVMIELGK